MGHPHHTRPPDFDADRSVLETAVIAFGLSALIFVGTLAGLVAATAVGGDSPFALFVTLAVCFATVLLGAAGAARFSRLLVDHAADRRESDRRLEPTTEPGSVASADAECRSRSSIAPPDGDVRR